MSKATFARFVARAVRVLPVVGALSACESFTGPYGAALVMSVDRNAYDATAVPLPVPVGYLTRYDVVVGVRIANTGSMPTAVYRCDDALVLLLASASRTDAELADEVVAAMGFGCGTTGITALRPGESETSRVSYSGYSSDDAFMAAVEGPVQFVLGTPAGVLRSPSFRILLPPE